MRIVFMGTSGFAVPSLERLVSEGYEVILVVTQPDRPSGRGLEVHLSPIKKMANRLGISVFQPGKIRDDQSLDQIKSLLPLDAIVVAAFGQIIPQSILDLPKYGCINVHASLLPRHRGAAPVQYAIMKGDTVTGVTTMLMDVGLDTGDILLQKQTDIAPDETYSQLEGRLADIGAELIVETLEGLKQDSIKPIPQDNTLATNAPSIKKEGGEIDWSNPAETIVNKIRALNPRPGAYTFFDGKILKIWQAAYSVTEQLSSDPGVISNINDEGIEVSSGRGTVLLKEVQPEGRKRMNSVDFARGARILPKKSKLGK